MEAAMIIDHTDRRYRDTWELLEGNKYNGAYYYSKEIVENIIPRVDTDRHWITVNAKGAGIDHAIVFVHNNIHPEHYEWLKTYGYKDLIMVCGIEDTCEKVEHIGTPIYLPLSIDVEYVKQFKTEKTKETAYAGRKPKRIGYKLPEGIDYLEGMPREIFLEELAKYKTVYAVGRSAIEAKALGCRLKAYDERFPKVSRWKVIDNAAVAKILQAKLDEIDG